jgi:integrase
VFAPLRAILENAALHGLCDRPTLKAPKAPPTPTLYLRPAEVVRLIAAAPEHIRPLFVFLFAVGARASEAIDLEWSDVDLRGKRARLKQKQKMSHPVREVDLPPVAVAALKALPHCEGAVFRPHKAGEKAPKPGEWAGYRRDRESGGQFKKVWATACLRAGLPGHWREWTDKHGKRMRQWVPDHSPHEARHTWATWHHCIYKNLLLLRDEGGWETTQVVERYAKTMPDAYREEAMAWLAGGPLPAPSAAPAKRPLKAAPKAPAAPAKPRRAAA